MPFWVSWPFLIILLMKVLKMNFDLQKASIMKRFSAFLLDIILIIIVFMASMLAMSNITNYDSYLNGLEERLTSIQEKHNIAALEEEYGILFNDYQYMFEDEVSQLPKEVQEAFNECNKEMNNDGESIKLYETIMSLSMVIVSVSMLVAFILLEFVVPLFFKNGQTLGKKIFAIAVMRTDGVKISPIILFIRTILGKYTITTMVPIIMVLMLAFGSTPLIPLAVLLLILLIQLVLIIRTKTNSLIHDTLSSTVVVDFQSQMIFDSVEAKNEYLLRLHNEAVDKADY